MSIGGVVIQHLSSAALFLWHRPGPHTRPNELILPFTQTPGQHIDITVTQGRECCMPGVLEDELLATLPHLPHPLAKLIEELADSQIIFPLPSLKNIPDPVQEALPRDLAWLTRDFIASTQQPINQFQTIQMELPKNETYNIIDLPLSHPCVCLGVVFQDLDTNKVVTNADPFTEMNLNMNGQSRFTFGSPAFWRIQESSFGLGDPHLPLGAYFRSFGPKPLDFMGKKLPNLLGVNASLNFSRIDRAQLHLQRQNPAPALRVTVVAWTLNEIHHGTLKFV